MAGVLIPTCELDLRFCLKVIVKFIYSDVLLATNKGRKS